MESVEAGSSASRDEDSIPGFERGFSALAEMGAAFLCGCTGIENRVIDNSAAYVAGWLKAIKEDKKIVITSAAAAQKAADYILNNQQ